MSVSSSTLTHMETEQALYEAKRAFDKAKDAVNDEARVIFGENRDRWQQHTLLNELYYAMPAFSQVAGYMKRAVKLFAAAPELEARLRPLVQATVDAGAAVGTAKEAHEAAKAQRKLDQAAKKADKGDQNLIAAMAEPRNEYRVRCLEHIRSTVQRTVEMVEAHKHDLNKAYPYPAHREQRETARMMHENRRFAEKFFQGATSSNYQAGVYIVVRRDNNEEVIQALADKMVSDYFDGYIYKLSKKIGKPVKTATHEGSLWTNCKLTVTCEDGETQVWHTKCIFNCSCLGKVFNQWPTRRVS